MYSRTLNKIYHVQCKAKMYFEKEPNSLRLDLRKKKRSVVIEDLRDTSYSLYLTLKYTHLYIFLYCLKKEKKVY